MTRVACCAMMIPRAGSQTFTRTAIPGGYEVTRTSSANRIVRYKVTRNTAGARERRTTNPDGTQQQRSSAINRQQTVTVPSGVVFSQTDSGDPRFGLQVPFPKNVSVTTPGGLLSTTTRTRTVTLADPNNPLSLTAQTDTAIVNGRTYTTTYNQASKTFTAQTPASRQRTATINSQVG